MDIKEKAIVCHVLNQGISTAIASLKSCQEPDYIAALTTGFAANLSSILNSNIRGMTFRVGGYFIHQKPLAEFVNPPYRGMKSPELGDLLIVFKRKQNGEEQYNALLLQAKKNNNPFGKTFISSIDHQLTLYTKWPVFQYRKAGHLNGKKRSIHPKASTPGAQYLLIDEQPNNNCCCGYCHPFCPLCCDSSALFFTAPSSTVIQASHCFAWALIDFLEFHTGKPFVPKQQRRIDDWSQMIWDLLDISANSVFNRRKSGYQNTPRPAGDAIQLLLSDNNEGYRINNDFNNDEGAISVLVIEGHDEYSIKGQEQ